MDLSKDFPYDANPAFLTRVAYFCMEYAIDQSLKAYAGGLGFLAGSHMRSAYELKQNTVGIGILWKYGYYDQIRKADKTMDVLFEEKIYGFLKKTDVKFTIKVSGHDVFVTAYYLPPEIFQTAPVFFLTTDLPENDYLAKTICHRLYDSNPETKIAAAILLGEGGARLLEKINWLPDVYHLNESHGLPLAFHLYRQFKSLDVVRSKLRFTNHTIEAGGNQQTNVYLLEKMSFFGELSLTELRSVIKIENDILNHTLAALQFAGLANGVSANHTRVLSKIYEHTENTCKIISITNAQDFSYWADKDMYKALADGDDKQLVAIKKKHKKRLFEEVADQNGEIYDENVLTIVFAKRFGGYKRPGLLLQDVDRFHRIVQNINRPVQIIWAGKPYPSDYEAIALFDRIVNVSKTYFNCSVLVGYELKLSKLLKQGADVWLNVPRLTREASGTSGMTAAMNGTINISTLDGWYAEFAKQRVNGFILTPVDGTLPEYRQDEIDANNLYTLLEQDIIPMYYDRPHDWLTIVKHSMQDIIPTFDSKRMVREYYEQLYCANDQRL
ncbi:MAG: alpha-glucan family phosphorylase [Agriterribacter sp.]